ncbi:MAG: esterase [Acidobacteria bacterium]|nr:esterase [Acidobacteriota bacterium]
MNQRRIIRSIFIAGLTALSFLTTLAQPRGPQAPQFTSPEVQADRQITFRLYAPQAQTVRLSAGDIPGMGPGKEMTKAENGVWEVTIGPIDAGAYRYTFNVNGVAVIDPRNPATSESNNNTWSLVVVPGSDFMDTKNVPHGSVAEVTYYSTALSKFRRMHVYTPPGYEAGQGKYPVFYLLHGAGDCDDSWTSVGRAGFILDNLVAAKKARPMIVVMPAGHTRRGPMTPPAAGSAPPVDEFTQDFTTDIMPYVEKNYRVLNDRANRAIAGLSMGGSQTLNIAIPNLEKFAYVGVYSSGLLSAFTRPTPGAPAAAATAPAPGQLTPAGEAWIKQNTAKLDDANLKKGLKVFWFATGKDDFLLGTTNASVALFKKHGFAPVYKETAGGHTWINWRDYLNEFTPMLFQGK